MSLKYKISIAIIVIVAAISVASLIFLQGDFIERVEGKIRSDFDRQNRTFQSYIGQTITSFELANQIATYGSTFSANMQTYYRIDKNDMDELTLFRNTMTAAISDAQQAVGGVFDMMIVLDPNFKVIAYYNSVDTSSANMAEMYSRNFETHPVIEDLFREELDTLSIGTRAIKIGNQVYQGYAGPVEQNNAINGYVIIGQRIDNFLADDLNQKLQSDFTFFTDTMMLGTSFQRQLQLDLLDFVRQANIDTFMVTKSTRLQEATLFGERFYLTFVPFDAASKTYYVLGASLDEEFKAFEETQSVLLIISVGAILIGVIVSFLFANTITRPVTKLVSAVQEIENENYNVQVDVQTSDEIGTLAQNFNTMSKGLGERFELLKFVSKSTLKSIQQSGHGNTKLGGERKQLTMFFSDIRGFTAFSEKREPEEVIEMLNTYLRRQAEIVHQYGGDIDKFVGDEMFAIFEGESADDRAVACARDIQHTMRELNLEADNAIAIGIGINSGVVVSGNMGSEDRIDHTVLGNNVNLAARLCSKAEKDQTIISENVYKNLVDTDKIEPLEAIQVKGISDPVRIYQVN